MTCLYNSGKFSINYLGGDASREVFNSSLDLLVRRTKYSSAEMRIRKNKEMREGRPEIPLMLIGCQVAFALGDDFIDWSICIQANSLVTFHSATSLCCVFSVTSPVQLFRATSSKVLTWECALHFLSQLMSLLSSSSSVQPPPWPHSITPPIQRIIAPSFDLLFPSCTWRSWIQLVK